MASFPDRLLLPPPEPPPDTAARRYYAALLQRSVLGATTGSGLPVAALGNQLIS